MRTDWGISSQVGDLRSRTLDFPTLQTPFHKHMYASSSPIFSPWHYEAPMDEALSHSFAPSRQLSHSCGCNGSLQKQRSTK